MGCKDNHMKHCTMALTSPSQQPGRLKDHKCKKDSCNVETHKVRGNGQGLTGNIPLQINIPGNAEELTVFEDFTDNHNKTYLQLSSEPSPIENTFSVLDVKIFTRDSKEPIEIRLSTNPIGPEYTGIPRGIQIENFASLTVSNPFDTASTLRVYIEKTFCICCRKNGGH
ncbi:hypothetical protein HF078_01330 [Bacillus sp. RO2]|uniref:hypothetical protein n=1 Tax=Bacillus sp. RO2 TaxID=2723913 RepID=UPI00145F2D56|nr:hypothetical protein [Bacillus sp. RO2]NMH71708.1 hypothetical protein [Bacillus sp. RO2]